MEFQNEYDLSGEYGIGYSPRDKIPFYFDLEDFDKIKFHRWRIKRGCACDENEISMARIILGDGILYKYVGDKKDCRKNQPKDNLKRR